MAYSNTLIQHVLHLFSNFALRQTAPKRRQWWQPFLISFPDHYILAGDCPRHEQNHMCIGRPSNRVFTSRLFSTNKLSVYLYISINNEGIEFISAITQCLACETSARRNATCPSISGILMPPCRLLHDHAMPMRIRWCSLKQAAPKTLDDILEPRRSQRMSHKSRSEGMSMNFVTGQSLNRRKHIRRKQ